MSTQEFMWRCLSTREAAPTADRVIPPTTPCHAGVWKVCCGSRAFVVVHVLFH